MMMTKRLHLPFVSIGMVPVHRNGYWCVDCVDSDEEHCFTAIGETMGEAAQIANALTKCVNANEGLYDALEAAWEYLQDGHGERDHVIRVLRTVLDAATD